MYICIYVIPRKTVIGGRSECFVWFRIV